MRRNKRFGQHFLKEIGIVSSIVEFAALHPADRVVEIGPGLGVLTKGLAKAAGEVVALELDRGLLPLLEKNLEGLKNVTIIQGDALSFDFSSLQSPFKVVSNLPYNISVPLIMRLLTSTNHISDMVLMVQREVADRLCAGPGIKSYGSLSVAVQYHAQVTPLMPVSRHAFDPVPRVESTVVRVTPREKPAIAVRNEQFFFHLVRTLFSQRRKTIKNNFKSMNIPGETAEKALERCGIDPKRRGETLNMGEFAALADMLEI